MTIPVDGAHSYKNDLPDVQTHSLDTGHFALEDKTDEMIPQIRETLGRIFTDKIRDD